MTQRNKTDAIVYKITNLVNGKFYIGITCVKFYTRWSQHKYVAKTGSNTIIAKAIRKYGAENFKHEILNTFSDYELAKQEEIKLIAELNPPYNSTKGGDGALGYKHTKETRESISKRMRGTIGYWKGKQLPASTIAGTRKYQQSRTDKHLVLPLGPLTQQKRIVCLNDGKEFACAKDAAQFYELSRREIGRVCRKETIAISGKVFRYLGEHNVNSYELDKIRIEAQIYNIFYSDIAATAHPRFVVCENDFMLFRIAKDCGRHYGFHEATVVGGCNQEFKSKKGLSFQFLDSWCVNSL